MEKNLVELNREATMQKWIERIAACRRSKLTVTEWCQRNNVTKASYYAWQKRIFNAAVSSVEPTATQFAEISLTSEVTTTKSVVSTQQANEMIAILESCGITAKIYSNTTPKAITAICRGLRQC